MGFRGNVVSVQYQLRREIVRICRMLHQKNLVAATDGNVSVRLDDRLLITPSGVNKGEMTEDQVITVDLEGQVISGWGKPTSEMQLHLLAYQLRPEIRAVVHAHPPMATVCSLAGVSLLEPMLPEVVLTLGGIPTAAYATPTTSEVPAATRDLLSRYDAIIMARHGAVTVGRDLMDAYNKMEKVEHTAHIILTARLLGEIQPLSPQAVEKLEALSGQNSSEA
jgi:L-fuculose-phosphate aldolase